MKLAVLLAFGTTSTALVSPSFLPPRNLATRTHLLQSSGNSDQHPLVHPTTTSSRRTFVSLVTAAPVALTFSPSLAEAGTVIDIQRYGDKELKIATINKVKQLLRNNLLQEPGQGGDWVRLAISDALSFSLALDEGGPNAAIQFDDATLKTNSGLQRALALCKTVQKQVLKTTEVSLADVIAYAGAEAIEASGGPRIQVQIGRYDAPKLSSVERGHLSWSEGSGDVVARFESAGISIRDCVVLVAALGSVELAAAGALGGKTAARVDPEDDEDEMFPADGGIFIPATFGSQKAMFGDLVTKDAFDTTIFKEIMAGRGGAAGTILRSDDTALSLCKKYASGKTEIYRKDLADSYIKLTVVGASLTGAKVFAP